MNTMKRLPCFKNFKFFADRPIQFVFPRVNPIKRDASVMTHQAEMVNVWED